MIPGNPVLYVRHSALDSVESDDVDRLREVWSSFSGAKKSLNQGTRLEYLSWRLYTRGILQKHRQTQEQAEVPPLVDPPGLEMVSSSESIHRGYSSHRVVDLFDRICTNPATPVDSIKPRPILNPTTVGLVHPDSAPVEITPVTNPTTEVVPPPHVREGIDIQRSALPEVCGFDRVSVNNRSSVSLHRATRLAPLTSMQGGPGAPSTETGTGQGMFFIESSSDSEPDHDTHDIAVPVPTRPGLVRRKTVTFEEPQPAQLEESKEPSEEPSHELLKDTPDPITGPETDEASDAYEDVSDDDGLGWGDSDWDDFSEDDESMFSGRVIPPPLQQRRSLLSSMFAGSTINRLVTPEPTEAMVPSPDSAPRTSSLQVGSAPYLGRVASQSSLFETAMQKTGNAVEQIILNNNLQSHIPIAQGPGSHSSSVSIPANEVMERELSQSIRSNLSHKRLYDLDMLWRSHRTQRTQTPGNRRPTLSRSTTMPTSMSSSFGGGADVQDTQSYHARGW